MLGIFSAFNLKDLFNVQNGAPLQMLYALGVFSLLALFIGFAYASTRKEETSSPKSLKQAIAETPISHLAAVIVFSLISLATVIMLTVSSKDVTGQKQPPAMASSHVENILKTISFDDYRNVNGYPFPQNSLPGGKQLNISALVEHGPTDPFDPDGVFRFSKGAIPDGVTISVKNLNALENAFDQLTKDYKNVETRDARIAKLCKPGMSVKVISQGCADQLTALAVALAGPSQSTNLASPP